MQSTPYYCHILMRFEPSRHFFEKYSSVKFHANPSSGSRAVPCGQADRQTDMTKLIVAVRNFADGTKNGSMKVLQSLGAHTLIYMAAYSRILESSSVKLQEPQISLNRYY
jgi:hypothetical protein